MQYPLTVQRHVFACNTSALVFSQISSDCKCTLHFHSSKSYKITWLMSWEWNGYVQREYVQYFFSSQICVNKCLQSLRIRLVRTTCSVIYSSYSSMILFSFEIFVVLLLWLRHLLMTISSVIVFKGCWYCVLYSILQTGESLGFGYVWLRMIHISALCCKEYI